MLRKIFLGNLRARAPEEEAAEEIAVVDVAMEPLDDMVVLLLVAFDDLRVAVRNFVAFDFVAFDFVMLA